MLDESYADSRRDAKGNSKDDLAAPWFYAESPGFCELDRRRTAVV